jgi:hypothetical protein
MSASLHTYLQDHLAGARFAIDLLHGLGEQTTDAAVADFASEIVLEIEQDANVLQAVVDQVGGDPSRLKEFAAWTAQKASRMKLDLTTPIGIFEALEMLTLGVQGKLALWNALRIIQASDSRLAALEIDLLASRAIKQHGYLENFRLDRAAMALHTDEALHTHAPASAPLASISQSPCR